MAELEAFADRVHRRTRELSSPIAAGLDPRPELLPAPLALRAATSLRARARAYVDFAELVLDALVGVVPVVKVQIAFYETLGLASAYAYSATVRLARERGFLVIGDVKRGDIGTTAEAYAEAHLGEPAKRAGADADAVTLSPYLGVDGVAPFLERVASAGKGVFLLVRTSNPSAPEVQDAVLEDGSRVYERVAALVAAWGAPHVGRCGYSSVGMVIGATYPDELLALRRRHRQALLLVPGYGAQGGTPQAVAAALDDQGCGLLVASSREILRAARSGDSLASARREVTKAGVAMRDAIAAAFSARGAR